MVFASGYDRRSINDVMENDMAAIEKVCEFSGEYPSWKMYEYKRNLIQIMPKYRKLFKGADHELHIWKPEKKVRGGRTGAYSDAPKIHPDANSCHLWTEDQWDKAEREGFTEYFRTRKYSHGGVTLEGFYVVFGSLTEMRSVYKEITGEHLADFYTWELRVSDPALQGEVDGVYHNWGFNISTTKRKIKRMLGCRKLNIIKHDITYNEWCKQNDGE